MSKKRALGRGLDAILSSPDTDITSSDISGNYVVGAVAELELSKIETNPFQPRSEFEELALEELATSIKKQGIIQPITVRKLGFDKYQLISGERRFRASKKAGLTTIAAYIRVANDEQMLEMALVENIQRENLNSIEIGISYQRLIDECQITQEELSRRVGKNRSTITNYIRLLKLPAEVQLALRSNQISMGHARALINIDNIGSQLKILEKVIEQGLSVREVEKLVKELINPLAKLTEKVPVESTPAMIEYSNRISQVLGRDIQLKPGKEGKGKILIDFDSEEELRNLMLIISGEDA
ncbi:MULTISPECIES: ParB/RepB/Spo0J family partition protein [unclassified Lentimicrobium]|uniref:ParB/RepB/Spo0J family partition protein n=1 Tax=unclassified Lentimicrobium TaxID=2677434 RepID=UPI00155463C1|nr:MULTISPECIES: ParB/RepB/Spo0J family partition protein [unclassified Lentimicrobium]NPD46002.1 ParB/RepB/Spo0J family partition protein [Lentimicrobium sp. S6]NPD85202.1 ParB/RepB/Spo0J family partition protein [Lentimicrobium sp. L6]